MKYTLKIEINKPLNRVIELFDSFENLKKWQPELVDIEHLSGEPGKSGAKTRLFYKMGKREFDMIETIEIKNLPFEFSGTYETGKTFNRIKNSFEKIDENNTLWTVDNEFILGGFMKIMGFLMPGAFKKQSSKFINRFKDFVEAEN